MSQNAMKTCRSNFMLHIHIGDQTNLIASINQSVAKLKVDAIDEHLFIEARDLIPCRNESQRTRANTAIEQS